MARAMWKASLEIGDASLPVKLYAAAEDRGVHFRLLHRDDHTPVQQRMVDREGEEVAPEATRRGLEVEPGVFVALDAEDFAAAEPEASRRIEVTRCVPRGSIDLAWFERPYYLGPDGDPAAYFALAAALDETGRRGIARWTMRRKRYFGALEARGPYLALVSMRAADAVIGADQLERPGGPALRAAERKLAEQLVATLDAPFDADALRDEHRERVLALIEAKAQGRTFEVERPPARRAPADLVDALRSSLRAARERRVA